MQERIVNRSSQRIFGDDAFREELHTLLANRTKVSTISHRYSAYDISWRRVRMRSELGHETSHGPGRSRGVVQLSHLDLGG